MSEHPLTVAIIGAGLSGTLTATHLLRQSRPGKLRLILINPEDTLGRGLAYRFNDDNLLLNVPAGNMSAFADEISHFVAYCQSIDPAISASSFVSRGLYGDYLQHILAQTMASHPGVLELKADEAISVAHNITTGNFTSNQYQVTLASGTRIAADHVVLALGHQSPKFPLSLDSSEQAHVISPWDFQAMHGLAPDVPVMILGTSHTAVDALFCLTQTHRHRPVWMVSRHGLLPQGHRLNPQPPMQHGFPTFLRDVPATTRAFFQALRQEVARKQPHGVDWRDVLNGLRQHTPQLWQSLASTQQRRFLRHLLPFWDIHRHRLAPVATHRLQTLLQTGQVQVMAARIINVKKQGSGLQIQIRQRGLSAIQTLNTAALINCTGPSGQVSTYAHPLYKQLLADGLLQPDAHGLGIQVDGDYRVTGACNQPAQGLWYVGPLLKARYWEATAAPELRLHAQRLANNLLASVNLIPCAESCT